MSEVVNELDKLFKYIDENDNDNIKFLYEKILIGIRNDETTKIRLNQIIFSKLCTLNNLEMVKYICKNGLNIEDDLHTIRYIIKKKYYKLLMWLIDNYDNIENNHVKQIKEIKKINVIKINKNKLKKIYIINEKGEEELYDEEIIEEEVILYTLKDLIKIHGDNCYLWSVEERDDIIIKIKTNFEMREELITIDKFIKKFYTNHSYYNNIFELPIFENIKENEINGVFNDDYYWLAMNKFDMDIEKIDIDLLKDNWKNIVKECIKQLSFIHLSLNIVHTDIKPQNILIKCDDNKINKVSICDFGLATDIEKSCNNKPELEYYVVISGARKDKFMGPRMDIESILLNIGLYLTNNTYYTYNKHIINSDYEYIEDEVDKKREWEHLKNYVPEEFKKLFDFVNKLEWNEIPKNEFYIDLLKLIDEINI